MGDCEFDGTYCQEHGQQWQTCFADLRAKLKQADILLETANRSINILTDEYKQAEARARRLEEAMFR